MLSPAEDFKDMLEADGNVGTFGTDLFLSQLPDEPDACVAVLDGSGFAPDVHIEYHRPGVTVLVRGSRNGYQAAYAKARAVHDALHAIADDSYNGARYILIMAAAEPGFLGYDEDSRPLFSINFQVHRTPTS